MIGKIKERGITLIALVVTIIILLILAGVTLNIALSENGLLGKAKESAESYKTAQQNEIDELTRLEKQLEIPPKTIQEAKDNEYEFMATTQISDKKGNKIVIPKDFHIASESGDTVQQGIVIEDSNENQFAWIPVSNIDGDNDETNGSSKENGEDLIVLDNDSKVEITLGRYNFVGYMVEKTNDNEYGDPVLVQKGSECSKNDEKYNIWNCSENTVDKRENGGTGAKDLGKFVESVKENYGYYIARYEAGKGTNGKPVSKSGDVWNNITQAEASEASQKMYGENGSYSSDLVNSYAWDTAIVYIQAMGNTNYANANRGKNTELKETGTTGDEKCHIFDMAGNVASISTEYCTVVDKSGTPCPYIKRGGRYEDEYVTVSRASSGLDGFSEFLGFRTILYLE